MSRSQFVVAVVMIIIIFALATHLNIVTQIFYFKVTVKVEQFCEKKQEGTGGSIFCT